MLRRLGILGFCLPDKRRWGVRQTGRLVHHRESFWSMFQMSLIIMNSAVGHWKIKVRREAGKMSFLIRGLGSAKTQAEELEHPEGAPSGASATARCGVSAIWSGCLLEAYFGDFPDTQIEGYHRVDPELSDLGLPQHFLKRKTAGEQDIWKILLSTVIRLDKWKRKKNGRMEETATMDARDFIWKIIFLNRFWNYACLACGWNNTASTPPQNQSIK